MHDLVNKSYSRFIWYWNETGTVTMLSRMANLVANTHNKANLGMEKSRPLKGTVNHPSLYCTNALQQLASYVYTFMWENNTYKLRK